MTSLLGTDQWFLIALAVNPRFRLLAQQALWCASYLLFSLIAYFFQLPYIYLHFSSVHHSSPQLSFSILSAPA